MNDLKEICFDSLEVVKKAGKYILSEFGHISEKDVETKDYNSFVTQIDKNTETQLVKSLTKLTPEAVYITEEGTVINEPGNLRWIIDPLDGTTNFIHNIPFFSISIALYHNNTGLIGIVYDIVHSSAYYAWENGGAWMNENPITVSTRSELADTLISTGFPYYDFRKIEEYLASLKNLISSTRGLRRFGSAALDLAYVASGKYDGFFEYGLNSWDVAAGCLLVKEAGGTVSDFSGKDQYLFEGEIIASNSLIHGEMLKNIKAEFYS